MNELTIFSNPEFGKIRSVTVNNLPYFVGKDVAEALGYSNINKAIQMHVDDEDKIVLDFKSFSHFGKSLWGKNDFSDKIVINESGVYALIFSSKLPAAKKFKHWVTSEVLPSIRKSGGYVSDEAKAYFHYDELKNLEARARADRAKAMLINAQTNQMKWLFAHPRAENVTPKAVEAVMNEHPEAERTYSATEVGKMLGITATKVGRLANIHSLKTEEYGVFVIDKTKHCNKLVPNFRYNDKGVNCLRELLAK